MVEDIPIALVNDNPSAPMIAKSFDDLNLFEDFDVKLRSPTGGKYPNLDLARIGIYVFHLWIKYLGWLFVLSVMIELLNKIIDIFSLTQYPLLIYFSLFKVQKWEWMRKKNMYICLIVQQHIQSSVVNINSLAWHCARQMFISYLVSLR